MSVEFGSNSAFTSLKRLPMTHGMNWCCINKAELNRIFQDYFCKYQQKIPKSERLLIDEEKLSTCLFLHLQFHYCLYMADIMLLHVCSLCQSLSNKLNMYGLHTVQHLHHSQLPLKPAVVSLRLEQISTAMTPDPAFSCSYRIWHVILTNYVIRACYIDQFLPAYEFLEGNK